ncbi:MAG: MutH/Sau3AI family endonuclease [Veillonella sp.]
MPILLVRFWCKRTKLESLREFSKANIKFKTIRLEPTGIPKEHMSFEQIDFHRWINDAWEDSQLYENLSIQNIYL